MQSLNLVNVYTEKRKLINSLTVTSQYRGSLSLNTTRIVTERILVLKTGFTKFEINLAESMHKGENKTIFF